MPSFPKPRFAYKVNVDVEIKALRQHRKARGVPARKSGELLLATWNIANFGAQERRNEDRILIAEILSWFDVIAIQECRENHADLYDVVHYMGKQYRVVMSDAAGNNERMVFVYDSKKVTLLDEVGEIAFPPSLAKSVTIKGVDRSFDGFDRNPYLASFQLVGTDLSVQLVNVHLFFGSDTAAADIERRALETVAVAKWTFTRKKSKYTGAREIVALGDFNMPKAKKDGGNIVYDALTSAGLVTPEHTSEVGSSIASDNHYDQAAVFPETLRNCVVGVGVFDYDAVIYRDLWESRSQNDFNAYLRYYLSDHRPMWVMLRLSDAG